MVNIFRFAKMEEERVPLSTSSGTGSIEDMKPNFTVHNFVTEIAETLVQFQVLKMEHSLFIWIGSAIDPAFSDLAMALRSSYVRLPLSTKLMGPNSDVTSSNLASRLSEKFQKAVFVSYNLPSDRLILLAVEKRLHEEVTTYPEKFWTV
jgi:proteasome assembly chaperone 4